MARSSQVEAAPTNNEALYHSQIPDLQPELSSDAEITLLKRVAGLERLAGIYRNNRLNCMGVALRRWVSANNSRCAEEVLDLSIAHNDRCVAAAALRQAMARKSLLSLARAMSVWRSYTADARARDAVAIAVRHLDRLLAAERLKRAVGIAFSVRMCRAFWQWRSAVTSPSSSSPNGDDNGLELRQEIVKLQNQLKTARAEAWSLRRRWIGEYGEELESGEISTRKENGGGQAGR